MNSQLSPRDWELLSAYLDRQLKPKQVSSLEARLSGDPVLSAALGELQRTRDALRSLPKMRAPRNFTLTPQMVGQRSPLRSRPVTRLAPIFGFASALATFLLVLVVIGDLLGILTPSVKPVAQLPAQAPVAAALPAATAAVGAESNQTAAPSSIQAQQPEPTPSENATLAQAPQALQAQQALTDTSALTLTIESAQPFSETAETSLAPSAKLGTETITNVITATITAMQATGLGGGLGSENNDNMLMAEAVITPEGLQWNSTISVTVSPTETLTFPMTITMEGPGITATYETGVGGGPPEAQQMPTEPPLFPELQETPMPTEPSGSTELAAPTPTELPVPTQSEPSGSTEAPGIVAQAVEPPTPSPEEPQALRQAAAPTQAPEPHPVRSGQAAVRTAEIILALLALLTGLAALAAWLVKRI